MNSDFHVHSSYSDGSGLPAMVSAAAEAGLDFVGFADHCSLTDAHRDQKLLWNRNFDRTYERRREALELLDERHDLTVYDAVEVDYEPDLHDEIEEFLDVAGFDYAIGSVHYVGNREVFPRESFADATREEREAFVEDYYDAVVSLVDSELFAVVAHLDLVENHPELHGLTTDDHRNRVADALADSRTVPELNASHATPGGEFELFHPSSAFVEVLLEREIEFTVGTDAHDPGHFEPRRSELVAFLEERGIDPVSPLEA